MSLIAYRPVANVAAKEQGRDAPIAALRFEPTPTTSVQLARHRLLFRPYPGGFRLSAQHNLEGDGGPFVPIAESLSLLFALSSADPGLLARAGGEGAALSGPNLFLTNRNAGGAPQGGPVLSRDELISAKDRAWIVPRRHRARIPLPTSSRPNRVELRPYFGGPAIGDPISIEGDAQAAVGGVTIALEDQEGFAFLLRPKPQGGDQLIIADEELADMRPLGALELVLKTFPGPDPAGGREFTATFKR